MIITGQVEPLGEVVFWSCDRSVHPQTLLKFWGGSLWSWLSGRNLLCLITIHFSSLSNLGLYFRINRGTTNDHCGMAESPRWSVVQKIWYVGLPSVLIDFWGGALHEVNFQVETTLASSYLPRFSFKARIIPPYQYRNYHWSSWYSWVTWVIGPTEVVTFRSTLRPNRLLRWNCWHSVEWRETDFCFILLSLVL